MTKHTVRRGASAAAIFASAIGPRILLAPPGEGGSGGDDRDLTALAKDLKTATDEVKTFAEKAETEIKNLGKVTDETKQSADKALTEMNGISARLTDVEQKLVRRPGSGEQNEHKSAGQLVIENDKVKAAMARGDAFKGRVEVEVKAITSASATAPPFPPRWSRLTVRPASSRSRAVA